MASASSSAARLLIRDGKSAASLVFRARTASLTETVQNTGPAIRSLLRFNQTPAIQYPVFSETFPVMQSGFSAGGFIEQEMVSERRGKMEAGHGKRVVDNEREEEKDFDEEEIDDTDDDDDFDFDDSDEDDDDEEEDKYSTKKKK